MQVFLPYTNFYEVARTLDKKRLFKQVVECDQILEFMNEKQLPLTRGKKSQFNHPVCKMWRECGAVLTLYRNILLLECVENRGIKTKKEQLCIISEFIYPKWFGLEELHSNHRARLLYKDFNWYGKFGWVEKPLDEKHNLWDFS